MCEKDGDKMMDCLDADGNLMQVPPETWRDEVLPELLESSWDDINLLYGVITLAADNGFAKDVLDACGQAVKIDPYPERAAVTTAIIQLRAGDLESAENTLAKFEEEKGKTSLSRTYTSILLGMQNKEDEMKAALFEALEIDPNNDLALEHWLDIHADENDLEKAIEALEEISKLPNSWASRLHLGFLAVAEQDKSKAVSLFTEAVEMAEGNTTSLTESGGALMEAGFVVEMIDLLEPYYDPQKHGPVPGWILIQGYLATGQKRKGIHNLNKVQDVAPQEMLGQLDELRIELAKLPDEG